MLELFIKGGWVMYTILAASVLALTIILERLIFFARIRNDDVSLIRTIEDKLTSNQLNSALDVCKKTPRPCSEYRFRLPARVDARLRENGRHY